MALITCPDCKKQISDSALTCIHCGKPMHKSKKEIQKEIDQLYKDKKYFYDAAFKVATKKSYYEGDKEHMQKMNDAAERCAKQIAEKYIELKNTK